MTGHFEAKLTAKRETAAGIYLTVQVQPDDYKAELATLRVGSALMLGWAEIVNTAVEPIEFGAEEARQSQDAFLSAENVAGARPAGPSRRKFSDMPLSQQAAIRCGDNDFKLYLGASNEDDAAAIIKKKCCVQSRREIVEGSPAGAVWLDIERRYQSWLTDRQYAEVRR